MTRYAITIFLSAFLLFQVQPLIARVILPWFGGSSSVWTTCMMFFQIVLVLGYLYAHGMRKLVPPKTGWYIHTGVLVLAAINLLLLPLLPGDWLKPSGSENLTIGIVTVLGLSVGIPFFVLSTTGPLIQAWQSVSGSDGKADHGGDDSDNQESDNKKSPYRLYAVSNLGSMLALLSYPFLFEPNLTLAHQSLLWTVLFVGFACLCIASGLQLKPDAQWVPAAGKKLAEELSTADTNDVSAFRILIWLLLATGPSVMLLATTNLMCQQIASVPFLWIVPLSLYLLSFIICFDRPAWYHRGVFGLLLVASVFVGVAIVHVHVYASALIQIIGLCLVCFATSMSCHGELERIKPSTQHLTLFYLCVAIGGSLGGIFVVIIAPAVFNEFYEFQIGLIVVALLTCLTPVIFAKERKNGHWIFAMVGLFAAAAPLASIMYQLDPENEIGLIAKARNEYGLTSVSDNFGRRIFVSGRINHGSQSHDPEMWFEPDGYYIATSGIGTAFRGLREIDKDKKLNVGVIGLGIGAMLAWCEDEDQFDFYEINPAVERIARKHFKFMNQYTNQTEVHIGDGRVQLENQLRDTGSKKFDIIAADAFSSDAIPVHLLTHECIKTYREHLNKNGVLVFHISNRFVDLKPVLIQAAEEQGMLAIHVRDKPESDASTDWVLLTNNQEFVDLDLVQKQVIPWKSDLKRLRWTDDHASLVPIMNWTFNIEWEDLLARGAPEEENALEDSKPRDGPEPDPSQDRSALQDRTDAQKGANKNE